METGIKQVHIKKQNLNFHSIHFISLSLIISVHINGENTSSWLQFKILVLARDNNSCSFLWGLYHTAESIRAKNARPNSVAANVKLYFTACGKCSMCEKQKYCLISLVLTNLGWAAKKETQPSFPEKHSFLYLFSNTFLKFLPSFLWQKHLSSERKRKLQRLI